MNTIKEIYVYLKSAKVISIILLIILFTGCDKLEQNFELDSINELAIEKEIDSYTVQQYDNLKIEPIILESQPNNQQYEYEWKVLDGNESVVLSNEKNLDVEISITPKTSYQLQLAVTDVQTGLSAHALWDLVVNGIYYQGWLITQNKDNQATLSFVRTDNEVFHSPEQLANGKTYPGRALSTHFSRYGFYPEYSSILFFTTEGTYRFNPVDFDEMHSTADFFSSKVQNHNPAYGINVIGWDQYIVDQDGVYVGIGTLDASLVFSPFSDRLPGDYDLFPAALTTSQLMTYFYDNKHKRFMQVGYTSREILPVQGSSSHSYNMGNVGKTMIAWDKGRTTSSSETHYAIMEDVDGRYLFSLDGSTPGYNQLVDYSACPEFGDATSFATSGIFAQMYYAVGNKLYLYNMIGNSAELIYEFPNGYNIKDIELQRNTSRTLVVGVDNNNQGEVYLFDINDLGLFANNTYTAHLTGFGDIVHISYRQ